MTVHTTRNLSHEDIARRFVEAKAFDFGAMGKLITELGPELAIHDKGLHGVVFGKFNTLACMLPAVDAVRLVGNLGAAALTAQALEGAAGAD